MSKTKTSKEIRVGTSGWYYNHWYSLFYPDDLAKTKWFKFYTENFNTVEINSSYYHFPTEAGVKKWYKSSPETFIYAIKANRYITHMKKLKNVERQTNDFLNTIAQLKEKLGPILFQLPPSVKKDLGLLQDFLPLLKVKKRLCLNLGIKAGTAKIVLSCWMIIIFHFAFMIWAITKRLEP